MPDNRGVITYATYQVVVARSGDTVSSMATRIGLAPEELARHNGLATTYALRTGEVLAIPKNVGGTVVTGPTGWSPDLAISAIDSATGAMTVTTQTQGTPDDPLRHRVEPGDTAYSIARLYNVSVTALASWNGLGPDLGVRVGQDLMIPVADTTVATNTSSPTPTPATTAQPVIADPTPASTATSSSGFLKPVNGTVAKPYNPQPGPNKNDGIDFAVPAGTQVKAAEGGTVALVSDSAGSLGTIVLIRHAGDIMTIYGRMSGVTVEKGEAVVRGQIIGVVADAETPMLHFQVRKGSDRVDPAPYLQ